MLIAPLLLLTATQQETPGHLLLIGIDGLRPDALAAADTPNIDALIADGAYSDVAQAGPITVSGPGWTQVTSGVWGDKHGVVDNAFGGNQIDQFPDLFTFVESAKPELDTRALLSWKPLETFVVKGPDVIEFQDYGAGGDAINTTKAVQWMADPSLDALYFYVADVDIAGHGFGFSPTVPQYIAEIEQVDGQVGQVLAAMQQRPDFVAERWLVVLVSDHGGIGTGHAGGQPLQRRIPYLVSGAGSFKGQLATVPNQVDVAATCLEHLGIPLDPAWQFDGRSLGLEFDMPIGQNLIFNPGAEYAPGNDGFNPDRGVPGWRDVGPLTTIRYGSTGGFPQPASPGPPNRGENFFSGGQGTEDDFASLRLDLGSHADHIDAGELTFDASAWLGGYADQNDRMSLTVRFVNELGTQFAEHVLGPVTLADRQLEIGGADLTGLLLRETTGSVPPGTRRVLLRLDALHDSGGGTDGYADELHFSLHPTPAADCDSDGQLDADQIEADPSIDLDGNGQIDLCSGLGASTGSLSAAGGGTVDFELQAGTANAGQAYLLLGSLSGTRPGVPLGGLQLPLVPDAYLNLTFTKANVPPFVQTFGLLDAAGNASAQLVLPAGAAQVAVGQTAHHAYLVLDAAAAVAFTSPALPLAVLP